MLCMKNNGYTILSCISGCKCFQDFTACDQLLLLIKNVIEIALSYQVKTENGYILYSSLTTDKRDGYMQNIVNVHILAIVTWQGQDYIFKKYIRVSLKKNKTVQKIKQQCKCKILWTSA